MNLSLTNENVHLFLEEWHRMRQLARTDLLWLCNEVLGYKDVSRAVHGPILDTLQHFPGAVEFHKTVEDLVAALQGKVLWEPKCRLEALPWNESWIADRQCLFLFPRGHLKSTIATVAHSIQWILNYPNVRILLTTATEELGKGFNIAIRDHFLRNETLRQLFPEICPQSKDGKVPELGNLSGFMIPARDNANKKLGPGGVEPTLLCSTVGSAITGYHGDVFKNDDLVEKINSSSQGGIDDVIRHAGSQGDMLEKYNTDDPEKPLKGWVDDVGTPWDFSDLYQVIRNSESDRAEKGLHPMWNLCVRSAAPNWPEGPYLWPNRMGYKALKQIEDDPTKGPAQLCTPAYSPVLMADWSEKPIGNIRVGDVVMGFERDESFFRGKMRLTPTKVTAIHSLGVQECQRMYTTGGRVVDCTPQHKWFTGRYPSAKEPHRKQYAPARVGFELTSVVAPLRDLSPEQQRWMDWLGGIMDGEGSVVGRNTLFIAQSPEANPLVCNMIIECLNALGYDWTQWDRPAEEKYGRKNRAARQYMLRGGRKVAREVLVRARMAKRERLHKSLMAKAVLAEKEAGGTTVKRIEAIIPRPVYGLTTETGNYVVWGFASSNSAQYLMMPIVLGQGLIDDTRKLKWMAPEEMSRLVPAMSLRARMDPAGMEVNAKGTDNDFTALTVGGWLDGTLYVPSVRYGRPTQEDAVDWIFDLFREFPQIASVTVEKNAGGSTLEPWFLRECSVRGVWPPVVFEKRSNRETKVTRISSLRSWFQRGQIVLSEGIAHAGHRTAIESEIKGFPKYKHDDFLDTLSDLMRESSGGVSGAVMVDAFEPSAGYSRSPIDLLLAQMDRNALESVESGYNPITGFAL